jgi:CDP-diacylglycerol--serine O-phosphatidyltransferase
MTVLPSNIQTSKPSMTLTVSSLSSSTSEANQESERFKNRNRQGQRVRRQQLADTLYRRRYLIPNSVTVGNMFCGFLAIVYAASGRFFQASVAIGIAILLDGLDGRVARRLNATSKFGVEFDSFCDLVSFGLAPAILVYHWCYRIAADEFGVLVTFLFSVAAATRLARFNISDPNLDKFHGLPSPGAAGVVAAMVHFQPTWHSSLAVLGAVSALLLSLSFLMVSRIEYLSIKQFRFRSARPFAQVVIAVAIGLLWYNNKVGLFVLSLAYALSGLIMIFVPDSKKRSFFLS